MENKQFSRLYSESSNGKKKYWDIKVEKNKTQEGYDIIIEYGYIGTVKPIKATTTITKGKNIGKSNETSVYEQALFEAESKWKKKKSEGMTESENENLDIKDLSINQSENNTKIFPMLALNYTQRKHDIIYPCYVQPKLDGVRCVYKNNKLSSRQAKEFVHLDHIKEELKNCPFALDGELYSETLTFQETTGLVKKVKLSEQDKKRSKEICLVVYDLLYPEDYKNRLTKLKNYFENKNFKYVKLLTTEECVKKDEVKIFHDKYIKQGYEGVIIRNKLGWYQEGYRSKNLQKYKEFVDDEFKIVGYTEGTGSEKGLVIWICETKKGQTFQVRPKGTHDQRREIYNNGNDFIGKQLTVVYQELTDDGIPRFPTTRNGGIGDIRDYE